MLLQCCGCTGITKRKTYYKSRGFNAKLNSSSLSVFQFLQGTCEKQSCIFAVLLHGQIAHCSHSNRDSHSFAFLYLVTDYAVVLTLHQHGIVGI